MSHTRPRPLLLSCSGSRAHTHPPSSTKYSRKMLPPSTIRGAQRLQAPDPFSFAKPNLRQNNSSRAYYTSTNSASFDSLLFHPVPSPSLCFEEMLEWWPTSPQPLNRTQQQQQQQQADKHVRSRQNRDRDSISTLVDFGNWISQQSHSRAPSLLPPTPESLRQDLLHLKSVSVECPLSSTARGLSQHIRHQANLVDHQTTNINHLETLCVDLHLSSFTSNESRRQTATTITPVPSLTYSHYSTTSSLTADGGSPEARASVSSTCLDASPTNRVMAMNHQTLQALRNEPQLLHPNQDMPSYQDNSCNHSPDDTNQRTVQEQAATYPCQSVPNPNFDETRLQPPNPQAPILSSGNEVSYFDWDDEGEDRAHRGESRLTRMMRSITDLRAAERFIADAATQRNTNHKPVRYGLVESPVTTAKAYRPAYSRVHTDNSSTSPRHKHKQKRDRQRYSRSVSASDKISKSNNVPEGQEHASTCSISLSLPSKLGSIRGLNPTRRRKLFDAKSIPTAYNEQQRPEYLSLYLSAQDPTAAAAGIVPFPSLSLDESQYEDMCNKRHRRGRTISSGLEGFPQLPTMTIVDSAEETPGVTAPRYLSAPTTTTAPTPTPPMPTSLVTTTVKRKRFSTFASLAVPCKTAEATPLAREKTTTTSSDDKRPKLVNGVVTRWVRRVFGASSKTRGTSRHRT